MRLASLRDPAGAARVGLIDGEEVGILEAASMAEWLSGAGRAESGERHALGQCELLAPVPDPPSVRDFYAFEGHVRTGWRRRGSDVPRAWYAAPAFYFSNPASVHGPGEAVKRPAATDMLDFELEIAAVIDGEGEIAGFTLMNDWSARDVQREEVTVGLGPAKAKDFATSLGPWLVTPDELPYEGGRLHLEATASVNGRELTRSTAADKHYTWPDLVAHAARDTRLRPGDVIGSGTLNQGCLMELGGPFLEPGDVVTLAAPGLGALENQIT
jgi:fumarylacetoacetate (FAA) hydrolase